MKLPAFLLLVLVVVAGLPAEVAFSSLDLDSQNRLLFAARSSSTAGLDYQVWFRSDLAAAVAPAPLTFYPEQAVWLPALGQLQIRNRFGVWRVNPATGQAEAVAPQVFGTDPAAGEGKLLALSYSPDGRTVLDFKPVSSVAGDLEWRDVTTMAATTVSSSMDLSFRNFPALWSPDGQFFVYEKKGDLYYYSLRQARDRRVPEENLRRIGPGLLSSITWGDAGELYYVADQVLYRILPEEFFTRSLYRAQFQTWGITGKLPFPFRPASDRYWLAPDGRTVLFSLGGRTLFVYPLDFLDFYQTAKLQPLTYLPLPQNLDLTKVVWTRDGRITILASALKNGQEQTSLFRISTTAVQTLDAGASPVIDLVPSPDETALLVVSRDGVSVRDPATFAEKRSFAFDGVVQAAWSDGGNLVVAARTGTSTVAVTQGLVKNLLLGGLDQAGYVDGQLVGRQGTQWYLWQAPAGPVPGWWKPAAVEQKPGAASTATLAYRAFLSDLPSGPWKNTILVRDLKALSTKVLLASPEKSYEPFPTAEAGPEDPTGDGTDSPFRHGSRVRLREVALAIDALDSSEGLPEVLRSLKQWGFKATFFVNGEFLRRNPQAAQEIAASGHEVANLFHIPLDLTSPGFIIDASFVRQGLARQEDDWYAVTGKELGLLWHAPGWVEGPALVAGAKTANYKTIGSDLAFVAAPGRNWDSSSLVEAILKAKKPGSIVPLTLGRKDSTTGESFFTRWDLLLNGLVEAGYRGVTVTQLMDHSRS